MDQIENVSFYTRVMQPPGETWFGYWLSSIGDVDADGTDDLMTTSNGSYPPDTSKGVPGNYLLQGRKDGDFNGSQLKLIHDISNMHFSENERGVGDLNGDGFADVVSTPYSSGFQGTWWTSPELQVRYGTAEGLPGDQTPISIDVRPSNVTRGYPIGILYGGAGDVNGDGFDDLCVLFAPTVDWDYSKTPGELQLYWGSSAGLSAGPGWTLWIRVPDLLWWYEVVEILHGDVNGDGFSDIILHRATGRGYDHELAIFHGASDGLPSEPNRTVVLGESLYYETAIVSPIDFNGDRFDDILAMTQTELASIPEGPPNYSSVVFAVLGAPDGAEMMANATISLDVHSAQLATAADINGDGLDDIVVCSSTYESFGIPPGESEPDLRADIRLALFLNSMGNFSDVADWVGVIQDINHTRSACDLTAGDFNGDGLQDLGIALWGGLWGNGSFLIVDSRGIFDQTKVIDMPEGGVVYAMHHAYEITVKANPKLSHTLPDRVVLRLDPMGADVVLSCKLAQGSDEFAIESDPGGYVTLSIEGSHVTRNETSGVTMVHFMVLFGWGWPHDRLCSIVADLVGPQSTRSFLAPDLFRVENDLGLIGSIHARGEWQGPLQEGAWVRAGENLTISGPMVVYNGTTDMYPPDESCRVMLSDDDGDFVLVRPTHGREVEATFMADPVSDIEETYTFSISELLGTSRCVNTASFLARVDGDLPIFWREVPEEDAWHSSTSVMLSITADDLNMSGVDSSTLEYAVSRDGPQAFGEWTRAELKATPDGPDIDGLVTLDFPDGDRNYIRWRVKDLVGNGFAISRDYNVRVDTRNVTFHEPVPSPDLWQTVLDVQAGVGIRDEEGSGIDVSTIQYRLSPRNLSQYGEWLDWDEGSTSDERDVKTLVSYHLDESPWNYIQWRAMDIAGNGYTTSPHYRIPADVTAISFSDLRPAGEAFQVRSSVMCWATASDGRMGSGVDLQRMEYRYRTGPGGYTEWAPVGMTGSASSMTFSVTVQFQDGRANLVQFRGHDVAGNGPTVSQELTVPVDTTPPELTVNAPREGRRQTSTSLIIDVGASDQTSGVNVTSLMYRYSTQGESGYGEWARLDVEMVGVGLRGIVTVTLVPGPHNLVQLRASDVAGNEASPEPLDVWVNRAPVAIISTPLNNTTFSEEEAIQLTGNSSSDPDGDRLEFSWTTEGSGVPIANDTSEAVHLKAGTYNITLLVRDEFGAFGTATVQVTVETPPVPEAPRSRTALWQLVLLLVILFSCGVAAGYILDRRWKVERGRIAP